VKQGIEIGLRMLAGGTLVVLFALVGDVLKPKMFAGLFGAAPSVAAASLLVGALADGTARTSTAGLGMAAGSVGMIAYCVAAIFLVRRLGALVGSVAAWGAWLVVAAAVLRVMPA
jgi:uncharacterized membrane protein (GlpM family)